MALLDANSSNVALERCGEGSKPSGLLVCGRGDAIFMYTGGGKWIESAINLGSVLRAGGRSTFVSIRWPVFCVLIF